MVFEADSEAQNMILLCRCVDGEGRLSHYEERRICETLETSASKSQSEYLSQPP